MLAFSDVRPWSLDIDVVVVHHPVVTINQLMLADLVTRLFQS